MNDKNQNDSDLHERPSRMAKRIEMWDIKKLLPYTKNARTHSKDQVSQIARSIQEFGFNNPILVDSKSGVIAGHGRLAAAKRLRLKHVPVIVLDHMTDEQRRAYILADNKIAMNAGWDDDLLEEELKELKDLDFDIDLIGFSDEELEGLLDDEPGNQSKESDHEYTKKIDTPVYEPKGLKPEIRQLYELDKTQELTGRIQKADLPEDLRDFLLAASARHTVFDYEMIAEYYAHASPEVKELFEDSALVIIDFDKAIEKGFVKMTGNIAEAYDSNEQSKQEE